MTGPSSSPVNVAVVEPLDLVRAGLAALVSAQGDMDVVAEAASAEDALASLERLGRGAAVLSLVATALPSPRDACWLIGRVRDGWPAGVVLGLGAAADKTTVSKALLAGAHGFVDKSARPPEFLAALRRAAAGEVVLSGVPDAWVTDITAEIKRQSRFQPVLTAREREVLAIAAEGLTARQIGRRMGLRERTVTTHLTRIYSKLGVNSRIAAISAAARDGMVSVDRSG